MCVEGGVAEVIINNLDILIRSFLLPPFIQLHKLSVKALTLISFRDAVLLKTDISGKEMIDHKSYDSLTLSLTHQPP